MAFLYVHNTITLSEKKLSKEFSVYGLVTSCCKPRGKNYAFVTFDFASDAEKAKKMLNGALINGVKISVAWRTLSEKKRTIKVVDLPENAFAIVDKYFPKFGKVKKFSAIYKKDTEYMEIVFSDAHAADQAKSKLEQKVEGGEIVYLLPPGAVSNIDCEEEHLNVEVENRQNEAAKTNYQNFEAVVEAVKEPLLREFINSWNAETPEPWEDSAMDRRRFCYGSGSALFFSGTEEEQKFLFNRSIETWPILLLVKSIERLNLGRRGGRLDLLKLVAFEAFGIIEKKFLKVKFTDISYDDYRNWREQSLSLFSEEENLRNKIEEFNPVQS